MQQEDTDKIVCKNPECKYYLEVDGKVIEKSGKCKTGDQRYYCKHCGKYFIDTITCQNPECEYYLKVDGKAVVKSGKYKTGHQRYYCKHCGKYFMETIGTSVYRKHLSKDEIRMIYRLFIEKNGIRSIERITGHHRDTVSKLLKETVKNEKTEGYLTGQIGLTADECKKLWKILESKRKTSNKTS